ncbi:hypothetical protein B0H11DRAFT_2212515 [Mycena galericulata]|nr:hypothetical protein B0H11DRAFT_2212515 [Mycena galericulata]
MGDELGGGPVSLCEGGREIMERKKEGALTQTPTPRSRPPSHSHMRPYPSHSRPRRSRFHCSGRKRRGGAGRGSNGKVGGGGEVVEWKRTHEGRVVLLDGEQAARRVTKLAGRGMRRKGGKTNGLEAIIPPSTRLGDIEICTDKEDGERVVIEACVRGVSEQVVGVREGGAKRTQKEQGLFEIPIPKFSITSIREEAEKEQKRMGNGRERTQTHGRNGGSAAETQAQMRDTVGNTDRDADALLSHRHLSNPRHAAKERREPGAGDVGGRFRWEGYLKSIIRCRMTRWAQWDLRCTLSFMCKRTSEIRERNENGFEMRVEMKEQVHPRGWEHTRRLRYFDAGNRDGRETRGRSSTRRSQRRRKALNSLRKIKLTLQTQWSQAIWIVCGGFEASGPLLRHMLTIRVAHRPPRRPKCPIHPSCPARVGPTRQESKRKSSDTRKRRLVRAIQSQYPHIHIIQDLPVSFDALQRAIGVVETAAKSYMSCQRALVGRVGGEPEVGDPRDVRVLNEVPENAGSAGRKGIKGQEGKGRGEKEGSGRGVAHKSKPKSPEKKERKKTHALHQLLRIRKTLRCAQAERLEALQEQKRGERVQRGAEVAEHLSRRRARTDIVGVDIEWTSNEYGTIGIESFTCTTRKTTPEGAYRVNMPLGQKTRRGESKHVVSWISSRDDSRRSVITASGYGTKDSMGLPQDKNWGGGNNTSGQGERG